MAQCSYETLSRWYQSGKDKWRTLQYYLERAATNIMLLEHLDIIGRTRCVVYVNTMCLILIFVVFQ